MANKVFQGVDCFGRDTIVATRDCVTWYVKHENEKWFVPNVEPVIEGDVVILNFRQFRIANIRVCLPNSREEKIDKFYRLKDKLRNKLNFKPMNEVIASSDYRRLLSLAIELKAKQYTTYKYFKAEVDPIKLIQQSYVKE